MLLTDKQVTVFRRAVSVLGLGFLLFYLAGWITAVAGSEVYREIIGCAVIATLLTIAIVTDFIQQQQGVSAKK